MKYYNLDMVVRGWLFNRQYPIHWYAQALKYAIDCLTDLHIYHDARIVNTKLLPVRDDNSAELPCDYVQFIRVGLPNGQYNRPLTTNNNMSSLVFGDESGKRVKPNNVDTGLPTSWNHQMYESYINEYGERLGRWFNHDDNTSTYKIVLERGEIIIHPKFNTRHIVLEYISDGIDADAATRVWPGHMQYIYAYISWRLKEESRQYSDQERERAKAQLATELRKVRAQSEALTIEDVRGIIRRSFTGTYRN